MINPKWESAGIYEHPAKHQKGTYGKIQLSQAGIYVLVVGGAHMSCPPEWAAKIQHDEMLDADNDAPTQATYIHMLRLTAGEEKKLTELRKVCKVIDIFRLGLAEAEKKVEKERGK